MDQRSFQKLLRRTVLLPVALLLLLAATLVAEILLLNASIRWVDHTDQVIANARQLIRSMIDMESGLRGYFLTGDRFFLDSYIAAKSEVPAQLALLEQLTSDNPDQTQRIGEIRNLDLRWIRYADNLLLRPNPRTLSSQDYAAGDELMNRIRAKEREILDAEDRLHRVRYRRAAVLGNIVIGTAVGLSLLTAVLLFTLTRRELFELSSAYDKHLKAEAEKTQQLQESR